MIRLKFATSTDTGLVRRQNEDSILADPPVFAVADGMGGHVAGDVASAMTVAALSVLGGREHLNPEDVIAAIGAANQAVREKSADTPAMHGMGTTLVGLAIVDEPAPALLAFNVGDSRLYRLSGSEFVQVSHDHSEAQELLDEGVISAAEAEVSLTRHVLTRAIGTDDSLEVDCFLLRPRLGERYLICSDGLTGELSDEEIASFLTEAEDPAVASERLVAAALASGGRDNVSVVILDVVEAEPVGEETGAKVPDGKEAADAEGD